MPVTDFGDYMGGGDASPFDAAWRSRIPPNWITFPDGSMGPPNPASPFDQAWQSRVQPSPQAPRPGLPATLPGAVAPTPQGGAMTNAGSWNWPSLTSIRNSILGSPGETTYLSPGGGVSVGPRAGSGSPPAALPPRLPFGGPGMAYGLPAAIYGALYSTPAETGELPPQFWNGVARGQPGAKGIGGDWRFPLTETGPENVGNVQMPARPTSTGRMPQGPLASNPPMPPPRPRGAPQAAPTPAANKGAPQRGLYALGGTTRAIGSARNPLAYDPFAFR